MRNIAGIIFNTIFPVMIILMILQFNQALAGSTGKISGTVVKRSSERPLVGADIIIDGIVFGATSDLKGRYFIGNIPPGRYMVSCRMMGYATIKQTNVYVASDLTTTIDFELGEEVVQGEDEIIVADQSMINKDVTGSKMVMTEEDMELFSQDAFQDFMESQVGIFILSDDQGTGMSIRGGDINETNVMLNGISMRNALTQQPNLGISLTSIQEVTITTGGFTAEYGDIRSGLVNIITKEGSREKFSFSLDARIGPAQKKHFGPNPYSVNGPVWNVYTGDQAFEGVTAEDVANGDYAFEFVGWNRVAEQALSDLDPDNDHKAQQWMEMWRWRHRNIEYANKPDYIIDGSFSGPFPIGNTTFLLSQHYENLQLAYPFSRNNSIQSSTQANLTFRLSPEIKTTVTNLFILERGVATQAEDYSNGMITGTKSGSYVARDVRWNMLYNPFGINPIERKTYLGGIQLNHALNSRTYYTLNMSSSYYKAFQGVLTHRDTSDLTPVGNVYMDPGPQGFFDQKNNYDMFDQFLINGGGRQIDDSEYWQFRFKGFVESQVNYRNLVKAGVEAAYTQFHMRAAEIQHDQIDEYKPPYFLEGPVPRNTYYFDDNPLQISAFIQDKLEYSRMIANLGIRFDYFNAMRPAWNIDNWNPNYRFSEYRRVDEDSNYVNIGFADQQESGNAIAYRLSPRLGISFPVTDVTRFFFNYGHFYQLPISERLFNLNLSGGSPPFTIPNLKADWPKTVMYEIGFEKAVTQSILFRITAYYKDVSNQLSEQNYIDFYGHNMYITYGNNNYEVIRGIEMRLQQKRSRFGYGWIDFEYMSTHEGWTEFENLHQNWLYALAQRENIEQEKNWPAPRISVVYSFLLPDGFGPEYFGFKPLSNWSLQINGWWRDGGKRIFGSDASIRDGHYIENIDQHNVDLILRKSFDMGNHNLSFYARIRNVTNSKGNIFPYNSVQYRNSLHLPWLQGDSKGNDKYGEGPSDEKPWIDAGWQTWRQYVNPRHVMFGMELNFN